jgi:hypothetical protein
VNTRRAPKQKRPQHAGTANAAAAVRPQVPHGTANNCSSMLLGRVQSLKLSVTRSNAAGGNSDTAMSPVLADLLFDVYEIVWRVVMVAVY